MSGTNAYVIGDKARVVAAFCQWLTQKGWEVETEKAYRDIVATRYGRTI